MEANWFDDVTRVFTVPKPAAFTRAMKATARPHQLYAAIKKAEADFRLRPTLATWRRLVKASRQLHALKRENDKPPGGDTLAKPPAPSKPSGDPFLANDAGKQSPWLPKRPNWILG